MVTTVDGTDGVVVVDDTYVVVVVDDKNVVVELGKGGNVHVGNVHVGVDFVDGCPE